MLPTTNRLSVILGTLMLGSVLLGACGDKGDDTSGDGGTGDGGTGDAGTTDGGTGDGGTGDGGTGDGGTGDGGTGGDGGTVEPDERDGEYRGAFVVRLIEPKGDLVDECVGQATIRLVVNADEPVRGNGDCRFVGDLAEVFPDPIPGVINGAVEEDGRSTGPIRVIFSKEEIYENVWAGTVDAKEEVFQGQFSGGIVLDGTDYMMNGSFMTTKVPPKKTE